jgi:hypothetical protein
LCIPCIILQFVAGNCEQDLRQASLLCKLDYEERNELYEQLRKDDEEEEKNASEEDKVFIKAEPMSPEQFNSLHLDPVCESGMGESMVNGKVTERDKEFFDRIEDDTKTALDREQTLELRKAQEVGLALFHSYKCE